MKKSYVKQKRICQLLLIIIAVLFLSLSYKAILHHNYISDRMLSWNNALAPNHPHNYKELTINSFITALVNVARFEFQRKFTGSHLSDSKLDTFYLSIDKSKLKKLNSDLPFSGKKYVKAFMKHNKNPELFKVKVKYRGDMPNHWMYEKKSLRIKIKKSSTLKVAKQFNLINIDTYKSTVDLVTYKIAKELGIISPDFYPVRLFLNGDYMGVYFYLDQTKEKLLRSHDRMPGSIYHEASPDYLKTGDKKYNNVGKDGVGRLWANEIYWDKIASRNAEQKNNRDDIKFIINAINNYDDIRFYKFVNRHLNKDAYYKYFAIDTLTGSPHHTYVHNHKIYYDPYMGQFEPIEWDVRYWTDDTTVKDRSNYPLINRIKLNPVLEAERDRLAYKVVGKYSPKVMSDKYTNETNQFIEDLQNDKLRRIGGKAYSLNRFRKFIANQYSNLKKRSDFLKKVYKEVNAKFMVNGNRITFEINGNNPIVIDKNYLASALDTDKLYFDHNQNNIFDDKDILNNKEIVLYPGRIIKDGNFFGGKKDRDLKVNGNTHIEPHPEYYNIFIEGNFTIPKTLKVSNFVTNKKTIIENIKFRKKATRPSSIHPWSLPENKKSKVVYNGTVRLNKIIEHDESTEVIIKPGTKFIMGSNASIISYGKVIANGTRANPITFNARNRKKPWGAFVVQGKGANGSQFNYLNFKNGSLLYYNSVNYTAPFNIHAVDGFKVSNCIINKNHIGDDAMHIAYSKGVVTNSTFKNARSDALDIDISTVRLIGNKFFNSGNDAIDSMTSDLYINKNTVINAADKCVSVGERSTGLYENNIFDKCMIGLDVKDESVITVRNTTISNSKAKAIYINRKNLYYNDAGTLYDEGIKFIGNSIIAKKGYKKNYIKAN